MRALETLISRNMGFKLFKEIEQVKKQLSENPSSTLEFSFEAIQIQETITRRRFDRMIASDLAAIRASVHGLLQSAAVHPDQIDVVLRTGGSSLIPAVRQLLEEIFSQDRVQTIDPLISVTGGFAVVAHGLNPQAAQTSPGELITEVDPSTANLHIIGVGTAVYSDRAFIISRIPSRLHGLPALQTTHTSLTARDDAALQFCLNHPARIYVAYESATARIPYWLRGFDIENLRIEIEDEFALIRRAMQVYSKRFEPGTVILGGNQAEGFEGQVMVNYFVIVQPEDQVA